MSFTRAGPRDSQLSRDNTVSTVTSGFKLKIYTLGTYIAANPTKPWTN